MKYAWLLVPILIFASQGVALSQDYLPLATGNRWVYQGSLGAEETHHVTGTVSIWGSDVWVIRYENSTYNEGLENYWTTDPDGDVNVWGFFISSEGWGYLYRPSIKILDAPLYVGKEWSQTVYNYQLPDTTLMGSFVIAFRVYEETDLTVPAGTFHVFGIGQTMPPGFPPNRTLTGAFRSTREDNTTDWWADQVGEAQYLSDETYQLYSYEQPTPVRKTTWGAIKALYQ